MHFAVGRIVAACLIALTAVGSASAQSYSARTRYPNPDGDMALFRNKPCRDPWVTIAVEMVYGRKDAALCPIGLYNNGRWGSFNDLVHAVAATKQRLQAERITLRAVRVTGTPYVVPQFTDSLTGQIVAAGGGNLVAAGGGNIVAAGGGNIVGNSAAGLIGPDGATLIGNDAGSLRTMSQATYQGLPKVNLSAGYTLQGARVIRLPGGNALVVK